LSFFVKFKCKGVKVVRYKGYEVMRLKG